MAWMIQGVRGSGGSATESTVVLGPLAVACFAIVGLRYLFCLPAELRANWMFQTTENNGRTAWLRATDRFVIWCFLAPVYVCAVPVAVTAFGWQEAARLLAISFVMVLAVFEFWFRDWHKLPFTCSHLPGQRPAWLLILIGMGALSYLGAAAFVIYQTSRGWVVFGAVFPLACALWMKLRARRRKTWDEAGLIYEQLPEVVVQRLDIQFEPGSETAAAAGMDAGRPARLLIRSTIASRPPASRSPKATAPSPHSSAWADFGKTFATDFGSCAKTWASPWALPSRWR